MNIPWIILQIQFIKFVYGLKIILTFKCDKNVYVRDINFIAE